MWRISSSLCLSCFFFLQSFFFNALMCDTKFPLKTQVVAGFCPRDCNGRWTGLVGYIKTHFSISLPSLEHTSGCTKVSVITNRTSRQKTENYTCDYGSCVVSCLTLANIYLLLFTAAVSLLLLCFAVVVVMAGRGAGVKEGCRAVWINDPIAINLSKTKAAQWNPYPSQVCMLSDHCGMN